MLENVLFYAKYTSKKEKASILGQKEIGDIFWGTKCEKLHFRAFLVILSPKNVRQNFLTQN